VTFFDSWLVSRGAARPRGTALAPGFALGGMDGTGLAGASPATIHTERAGTWMQGGSVLHTCSDQKQSAAVS
jgi:hypothetical protein